MIIRKGDYVAVDHMTGTVVGFTEHGWPLVKPDPLWNDDGRGGNYDEGLAYPPWRVYVFACD